MEDIDLLTPKGHERMERDRRICEVLKKLMPEVERIGNKQWRAVCAIANEYRPIVTGKQIGRAHV